MVDSQCSEVLAGGLQRWLSPASHGLDQCHHVFVGARGGEWDHLPTLQEHLQRNSGLLDQCLDLKLPRCATCTLLREGRPFLKKTFMFTARTLDTQLVHHRYLVN